MSSDSSSTSSLRSSSPSSSSSIARMKNQRERSNNSNDDFYVRFYQARPCRVGSGHEFVEFELLPNGKLRHANNSNYHRNEGPMIRQEVFVSPGVVNEFRRMIRASGIASVDDSKWALPPQNTGTGGDGDGQQGTGLQEIECKMGNMHISFRSADLTTVADIEQSADPQGLKTFYFLAQDLKAFFHALISAHFKARPFG